MCPRASELSACTHRDATDAYDTLIDQIIVARREVDAVNIAFITRHKQLKNAFLFNTDAQKVKQTEDEVTALDQQVAAGLVRLLASNALLPNEKQLVADTKIAMDGYMAASAAAIGRVKAGGDPYTAQLASFARATQAMAEGDLTQQVTVGAEPIDIRGGDEIGALAATFNEMIAGLHLTRDGFSRTSARLRELVGRVQSSADGLASTSCDLGNVANHTAATVQQVAHAVQTVAAGAQNTARSANSTSSSVIEVGRAVDQAARSATWSTGCWAVRAKR